ncbi:MAG: PA2778 family cysteine peptidase [Burkholderiales bacterium]|nr:PA2778 family cysteine peptidase [Burkholderiales bacterium]
MSGCSLLPPTPQTDALLAQAQATPGVIWPRQFERHDLPLVLQEPDFCGPAALSMVLGQAGVAVTQEELGQKVFLPGRSGTLQTEMLAGTRRMGLVSFELNGQLASLLEETRQGRSPIVLLNLGLSWAPRWHYAVVMGYDLDHAAIILRSGTASRESLPLRTFEYTWARSQHWAMVVTHPGSLPTSVDAPQAEQAALGFDQSNPPPQAALVWQSLVTRWPDRLLPQLALGNAQTNSQQLSQAARTFEQAARQFDSAIAWNNLAQARLSLGDPTGAHTAAERGLARARAQEPRWIEPLTQTLNQTLNATPTPSTP